MTKIFAHTDDDGDEISFFSDERSPLSVEVKPVNEQSYIGYLDQDAVLRLRDALTKWLVGQGAETRPVYPADSLYGKLIAEAVKAEVTRVLPLRLVPFATQMQAAEDKISRVADALMAPQAAVRACRCHDDEGNSILPVDPEPRDVGHAECDNGCCRGEQGLKYKDAKPEPAVNLTWDDKVWGTHGEAPGGFGYECVCELHNHRPVDRPGSLATCAYRDCECRYRGRR